MEQLSPQRGPEWLPAPTQPRAFEAAETAWAVLMSSELASVPVCILQQVPIFSEMLLPRDTCAGLLTAPLPRDGSRMGLLCIEPSTSMGPKALEGRVGAQYRVPGIQDPIQLFYIHPTCQAHDARWSYSAAHQSDHESHPAPQQGNGWSLHSVLLDRLLSRCSFLPSSPTLLEKMVSCSPAWS